MPARILLIDPHQIVCDSLRRLLRDQADLELVGNGYDAETGWKAVDELRPDLVVMELNMSDREGAELTTRIHARFPAMKVMVLTGCADPLRVQAVLAAGATGYVLKGNGFIVLLVAIRAVLEGKTYLCPEVSTVLARHIQRARHARLTAREVEVLKVVADGRTTKEIASSLAIAPKTVESHRLRLMDKLNLNSIAELTKYAIREGLTTL